MAVTTSVFAVQDALASLISTAVATVTTPADAPEVTIGFPGTVLDEHIWIAGDLDDVEQTYEVSSLTAKDERLVQRVFISINAADDTYVVPRDRLRVLFDAVASAINTDFTLGGTVELAEISKLEFDEAIPDASQRSVLVAIHVSCRAWLT